MSGSRLPDGHQLERLSRSHNRRRFKSGEESVDDWLATKAMQSQEKHLSLTKVLRDPEEVIVGYYTLAVAQIPFDELPMEIRKRLPKRAMPVVVIAWLGVSVHRQRQGIGQHLLAQALLDCHNASRTLPFVAVVVDSINEASFSFYQSFGFEELPGHRSRLFISYERLEAILLGKS